MTSLGRQQLGDRIAEALRTRIVEGELVPGTWLRQEHLAREYGTSQIPIRDAFKVLANEGLVELVPYRGARVVEVAVADAEDLFACRVFAEGRVARFAAEAVTDDELAALREVRDGISRAIADGHVERYQQLNQRFHQLIIAASRRPLLQRLLAGLWAAHPSMLWPHFRDETRAALTERFLADEQEHDAVLRALERRDPDAAERAMRRHIEVSAAMLLAAVR
jgi:DNA-binding GntR family transcriptional regulator